jgi:pimeloyl-ACP methyl ester carboxylesterase
MRFYLVGDPSKVERLGPGHCHLPNEWPINVGRHWMEVRMPEMQALDIPQDRIRSLQHPVLTIHGTKDRNAPYGGGREWARLLPGARLLTVPGAAHQSWADAPDVLSAVDAFLAGKWPEAAVRVAP